MKIIYKNKSPALTFKDLKIGDVYTHPNNSGGPWMKINNNVNQNTFSLSESCTTMTYEDSIVVFVECELVIK